MKVNSLSRVQLLATLWTAAHQASPSMGFSRQEYWSGVPLPSTLVSLGRVKYEGVNYILRFPGSSVVKNPPAGDASSIPGLGRSPRGGNDNSLQYSCLENSTNRGA